MEQIINWVIENKEWLFSGLGITIIAFVVKKLSWSGIVGNGPGIVRKIIPEKVLYITGHS